MRIHCYSRLLAVQALLALIGTRSHVSASHGAAFVGGGVPVSNSRTTTRSTTTTFTPTLSSVNGRSTTNNPFSLWVLQAAADGENDEKDPKEGGDGTPSTTSRVTAIAKEADSSSFVDGLQEKLQTSLAIIQESRAKGDSIQQVLANVLAGEYDAQAVGAVIDEEIKKAPCVMFTWERSPSCVKAVEAFEKMGILNQVHIVRLDDPWDKGNPIRAEIGKRVGRSSVPMIFIGGEYVGGFDGGVDDETNKSPGIQTMAFQGTLRPALEAAGIQLPS